ncbi:hypothetical protein IFM89_027643 [Coptis chinensis]|uniref:DEAD/DEAH-box helicase domain-containing protein n=1 Tax=Coptis chinensis TaxID=261450 RepID=A0A835IYQ1_9MAGN|nr:hypothetical protein IFM89_027643 [Coptis chinensis]
MGQSDKKSIYIDNERYKVQFEIEDSTCKKLITTFDDEAEYLLQRPLDKLLKIEKQENGFDLVSEILEEPIGKEYEFEVRITKYNCENGKDSSLTVSKNRQNCKELEVKGWLLEWFFGMVGVKWMIWVLKAVDKAGYKTPSPIQMAAIPLGLQQRDVIGIAGTGSGKTATFVLPMLTYISRLPPMSEENEAEGSLCCCYEYKASNSALRNFSFLFTQQNLWQQTIRLNGNGFL